MTTLFEARGTMPKRTDPRSLVVIDSPEQDLCLEVVNGDLLLKLCLAPIEVRRFKRWLIALQKAPALTEVYECSRTTDDDHDLHLLVKAYRHKGFVLRLTSTHPEEEDQSVRTFLNFTEVKGIHQALKAYLHNLEDRAKR